MSHEIFLLPDVGEGLIEAEIVAWKVAVGDVVVLNQPLVDVETAKAVVELPSPFAGRVTTLHGEVGDVMSVDTPLVTFEVGAQGSTLDGERSVETDVATEQRREPVLIGYGVANEDGAARRSSRRVVPDVAAGPASTSTSPDASSPPEAANTAVRTTPPVRLLAKQWGVDLDVVSGSGRGGLITRDDVERARAQTDATASQGRRVAPADPPRPAAFMRREIAPWSEGPREERIALKGVAKAMAEAMVQSTTQQPQAVVWLRADVTAMTQLVGTLKTHENFAHVRLSALTFVALALCDAARHYPGINSSIDEATNEVVLRRYVNLGIAADTARGLIVPNIKGADELDLHSMTSALSSLVNTARQGTTTPGDMLGTTLTITNVGPFRVDGAMAILPPGTGAILCVGQIAKSPWVHDDEVCVRDVVELSLTFDHRHIDGALASKVLAHIGRFLHDPATALLAR